MGKNAIDPQTIWKTLRPVWRYLLPWVFFWGFFAYGWRIGNIFTHVPAYGDVLEVLWGIEWYYESLLVRHSSPLFTPFVFHPLGWHTATLAHTPFLFLVSLPLYALGGMAFAYNILAIIPLVIAFAGMFRFLSLFRQSTSSVAAALAFVMWGAYWGRIAGHLHVAWLFGLLPWLAWAIERGRRAGSQRFRWGVLAGAIWGLMINFHLYGAFIGALSFALWGREIFRLERIRQGVIAASVALLIGSLVIALYILGSQQDHTRIFGAEHNMWWGASLNSLFVPSVFHPIELVQQVSRSLYTGPYNESGVMNFGLSTSLLALIGLIGVLREKRQHTGLIWLTLIGIILGMGLLLRWNGEVVQHLAFRPLNAAIWRLGHILKPGVFLSPYPSSYFESGVPLPGFFLTAVIPFWEAGRTVSRYAVLGMLGAVALAGLALQRLPRGVRYLLAAIWLVEMCPRPIGGVPVPYQPHPAYAWLADQELALGEGIVDIVHPTLKIRGETLWATRLHLKPTASGIGSFWPEHTFALWKYLWDDTALSRPETGAIFRQYVIRYIFLHMRGDKENKMWEMVRENPAFSPVGCFDPLQGPTPWPYPICVAEVKPAQGPISVMLGHGWSGQEDWGVWAEGYRSEAGWLASTQPEEYRLRIGAFPFCVSEKHQRMSIRVNGALIAEHRWENCDHWEGEIQISASIVKKGWNRITLEYAYAMSPFELTRGANGDRRMLSVGFTKLEVRK